LFRKPKRAIRTHRRIVRLTFRALTSFPAALLCETIELRSTTTPMVTPQTRILIVFISCSSTNPG
jgi:hypothetical protein